MFDYFLTFCIVIALIDRNQGGNNILTKIVAIELIASFLLKTILKDLDLYHLDNMPFIMIVRNVTIFLASMLIFKYRKNLIWNTMVLLYVIAFIYNALAFNQLFKVGFDTGFESEYILVMRLIMLFMAACLFLNSFGGGIKNRLGSRLYFITSRTNTANSASQNMLSRINRLWSRS